MRLLILFITLLFASCATINTRSADPNYYSDCRGYKEYFTGVKNGDFGKLKVKFRKLYCYETDTEQTRLIISYVDHYSSAFIEIPEAQLDAFIEGLEVADRLTKESGAGMHFSVVDNEFHDLIFVTTHNGWSWRTQAHFDFYTSEDKWYLLRGDELTRLRELLKAIHEQVDLY